MVILGIINSRWHKEETQNKDAMAEAMNAVRGYVKESKQFGIPKGTSWKVRWAAQLTRGKIRKKTNIYQWTGRQICKILYWNGNSLFGLKCSDLKSWLSSL